MCYWLLCQASLSSPDHFQHCFSLKCLKASDVSFSHSVCHRKKGFSPLDLQVSLPEVRQRCNLNSHSFEHVLGLLLNKMCTAKEVGIFPFPWDL